jgi:valyl-tRNA synthetase
MVNVKPGYARNFLLPRHFAVESNPRNVKEFEHQKRQAQRKLEMRTKEAEVIKSRIEAIVCVADPCLREALRSEAAAFALLARVNPEQLSWPEQMAPALESGNAVHLVVADGVEVWLPLSNLVDAKQEKARLDKQAARLEASIEKLGTRLNAPGFADKAPAKVVEQAQAEMREQQEQLETVRKSIADLPPI